MKSLKELYDKNRKLIKTIGPDENEMFRKMGPDPYATFHELGPLDYFDFLFLPNKIKNKLKNAGHESTTPRT